MVVAYVINENNYVKREEVRFVMNPTVPFGRNLTGVVVQPNLVVVLYPTITP